MPICLNGDSHSHPLFRRANVLCWKAPEGVTRPAANCLDIGLINNMPDGALSATERHFITLLDAASEGTFIRLSFYALPEVPRSEAGRQHIAAFYNTIDGLWDRHFDAVIVTGTEPRAKNLADEPYWKSLARVIEWADQHTHSSIWSCLAAHAAVLHLDGIARNQLAEKRFGVFECARVMDHPLTGDSLTHLRMPHSRWNDLAESELTACGYEILTPAGDRGVDSFLKQRRSLYLFFQGHPEYEPDTLLLEYRRDVGRYLRGERDAYPPMPRNYFSSEAAHALSLWQQNAEANRSEDLLDGFPSAVAAQGLSNAWRRSAARIYGNWLLYLHSQKSRLLRESWKSTGRKPNVLLQRRFAAGD